MNIADIDLTSHGGNIDGHMSIGNLPTANGHFNGVGILQLDANGQADVCAITDIGNLPTANGHFNGVGILQLDANGQANVCATTDNCTVTIWTYGYVT